MNGRTTMNETEDRPVAEVFSLLCDLGVENGGTSIKDLPGCYTLAIDKAFIAINGSSTEARKVNIPDGGKIEVNPANAVMIWNGWLVYMGNPFGGIVLMVSEDELIAKIRSLFKNAQGFAE